MDNVSNMTSNTSINSSNGIASKNTLLTIILVLLILITGAMIFNFYGMRFQAEPLDIPKCVGSDDLNLRVDKSYSIMNSNMDSKSSNKSNSDSRSDRIERVAKLLKEKVGDYSDGSYHPELQQEMIMRAQESVRKRIIANVEGKAESIERTHNENNKQSSSNSVVVENMQPISKTDKSKIDNPKTDNPKTDNPKTDNPKIDKPKTDKPENGKVKLVVYHMKGCGHCHVIMSIKQPNGMSKFEELQKIFESKPNVEILDFQHGRDPEAFKFNAFPVIMLIKDGATVEHNRDRNVESMARLITQNM